MFSDNHKISIRQLQAMLLLCCFGTSSLFLPAELAANAQKSCWIVMGIGGLIATLFSLVLTQLYAREPSWTAMEWSRNTFGNTLGTILSVGFVLKLAVDGMLELRIFTEVLQRIMLPHTPSWLMVLVLLFLATFGVARGIEGQARTAEILFFFVFPPFLILLLAVGFSVKEAYFLPVTLPDLTQIRKGAAVVQPLFQAMLFLLFVSPFLQKPKQAKKSVALSLLFVTILLMIVTFLCLSIYGVETLSQKMFPTLQMVECIGFSGIFLSRQDILLLWFWTVSVFIYISGVLFFGSISTERLFCKGERKRRYWLFLWVPLLFVGVMLPKDMASAYAFRNFVQPFVSAVYLGIFPICFLCKSIWKERRKSS